MAANIVLAAAALKRAAGVIIAKGGSAPHEADLVAGNLVETNLRGHDSHGVGMIPRYVDSLLDGELQPNQQPEVKLDTGVLLRLDGRRGYGQAIGVAAMALGIERARKHGVCVIALANSHHLGRIGCWAEQCISAGLASVHFANVIARPVVAPWGGRDARLGTNPICIGIPRPGRDPIVLDMATSRIAQGKTRVAFNRGEELESGVLLDDHGDPTTNPRFAVKPPFGALLPFGEHKGYGLSVACELLGGALTGGGTGRVPYQGKRRVLNGMFSILIDPEHLGTGAEFARETEEFVEWVLRSPPASDDNRVKLAGDPEREYRKQRLAEGIPVDAATWEEILAAGEKLGVERAEVTELAGIARHHSVTTSPT